MGDLSRNFSRSEFACKGLDCCSRSAPVHPDLVKGLQELRDLAGVALYINSGFRCNRHNRKIDGSPDSFHPLAMAADISCKELTPHELAALANQVSVFREGGIGVYVSWVHLDVRKNGKARW
jgi:uncharacterized protein YcbK (DUF882 family)